MAKGVLTLDIRWQYNTTLTSKSVTICSRRVDTVRWYMFTMLCRLSVSRKHIATDVWSASQNAKFYSPNSAVLLYEYVSEGAEY
jgi:hypothetical protein